MHLISIKINMSNIIPSYLDLFDHVLCKQYFDFEKFHHARGFICRFYALNSLSKAIIFHARIKQLL